jgi:hypothetical protein
LIFLEISPARSNCTIWISDYITSSIHAF